MKEGPDDRPLRAVAIYHALGPIPGADEHQLDRLRRCCTANRWCVVEEYVDYQAAGGVDSFEHERLIADAHRRRFDLVLFHSLDLLCRGGCREAVVELARLFRLGIEVKSLEEPEIDSTEAQGDFLASLIALLARQESRVASRRIQRGMSEARRKGKAVGRPPLPLHLQREVARQRRQGRSIAFIARDLGIAPSTALKYSRPSLGLVLRRR